MTDTARREYRRTLGLVSLAHMYSHISILALPPVFVFLRAEFDLSGAELGLLVTLVSVGMLAQVPLGEVVDRVGAKWPLAAGQALTALGIGVTAVAPSYPWLLVGAGVIGLGQAPIHPANYALVATVATARTLGRSFSVHTFGGYVGFAVGPVLIGAAAVSIGWRAGLGALALAGLTYAVVLGVGLQPLYRRSMTARGADPSAGGRTYTAAIAFLGVFFIVSSGAEKGLQAFTPLFVIDGLAGSVTAGSNALAVFFGLTAVSVLVGGVLADRFDPRWNIAVATTIVAAALAPVLLLQTPVEAVILALFALAGGGYGLMFASRDRLVSTSSAEGAVGRSFGFVFSAEAVGGIVAPVGFGVIIDVVSIQSAFVVTLGLFVAAGLLALLQDRSGGRAGAAVSGQ